MKYRTNPALADSLRHVCLTEDIMAFQRRMRPMRHLRSLQRHGAPAPEPVGYYMRMAIACAPPEDVTVLLGRLEVDLYYVAVRVETRSGMLRSCWVVDDEIGQSRGHPAGGPHPSLRMTELFLRAEEIDIARFVILEAGLPPATSGAKASACGF